MPHLTPSRNVGGNQKIMQKFSKFIFWTSIILIILLVILPIFGNFTNLEFADDDFETAYDGFRFFLLPISILLTLFGTLKKKDTAAAKTSKIVLTVVVSVFSIFMFAVTVFGGMCDWSDGKILFVDNSDKANKIILRSYGCGATDSGSPIYKVFEVRSIISYLNSVTAIDTTKLDKRDWTRIQDDN
jgi:hypothetical protein